MILTHHSSEINIFIDWGRIHTMLIYEPCGRELYRNIEESVSYCSLYPCSLQLIIVEKVLLSLNAKPENATRLFIRSTLVSTASVNSGKNLIKYPPTKLYSEDYYGFSTKVQAHFSDELESSYENRWGLVLPGHHKILAPAQLTSFHPHHRPSRALPTSQLITLITYSSGKPFQSEHVIRE